LLRRVGLKLSFSVVALAVDATMTGQQLTLETKTPGMVKPMMLMPVTSTPEGVALPRRGRVMSAVAVSVVELGWDCVGL
jgi:hypothetical protein